MPFPIEIILFLGLLHAALLFVFLWRAQASNKFGFFGLTLTLGAVTAILIEEWFVSGGLWQAYPHVLRTSVWMPFFIGPGVWFFVESLKRPSMVRRDWLHLFPAFVGFGITLPFYLQSGAEKISTVEATHAIPLLTTALGIAKAVSLFAYFILLENKLRKATRAETTRLLTYTHKMVAGFLGFLILILVLFFTEHMVGDLKISSDLLGAVGLSLLTYALCLLVIAHWRDFTRTPSAVLATASPTGEAPRTELLDEKSAEEIFRRVEETVCSGETYKQPGLRLSDLSEQLGIAPHYLSYVINSQSGRNYNSWLNGLRVQAVLAEMERKPETTLLDLALENGFNSKASFNRAFSKETGVSPTKYRESASQIPK